jgi:hypothetical protein
MSKKMLIVAGLSLITLAGCATSDVTNIFSQGSGVATMGKPLPPKKANQVKLYYSQNDLPKRYQVIGRVSVENYNLIGMEHDQTYIAEELKNQAAKLGANGVLYVSSGLTQTVGNAIVLR